MTISVDPTLSRDVSSSSESTVTTTCNSGNMNSKKSPVVSSSLSSKFNEQEQNWSVYNKFDSLERQWSRLSSSSANSIINNYSSNPAKVIHMEELEHKKWTQLHAFATQEKQLQERDQPSSEERQDEAGTEHAPSLDDQPAEREEPGFVIKRRGAKRPRRLLALTKLRHWNVNHAATPAMSSANGETARQEQPSQEEEVMLFESSTPTTTKPPPVAAAEDERTTTSKSAQSSHQSSSRSETYTDESRDEQSSYQNLSERVLMSMPNHQLWETANEDERYGCEWQDAYRGAKKDMGIGSLSGAAAAAAGDRVQLEEETTIVFSASSLFQDEIDTCSSDADGQRDGVEEQYDFVELMSAATTRRRRHPQLSGAERSGEELWDKDQLLVSKKKKKNRLVSTTTETIRKSVLQPVLRDLLRVRLCTMSVVVIQSWIRAKLARRAFLGRNREAGQHQHHHKESNTRRRRDLSPTLARVQSTRKFQSAERSRKSATIIQTAYRCWDCRRDFLELRNTVVKAQRCSKQVLKRRQQMLAAAQAQHEWLNRGNAASQWSFDGTGISALSFDNSYLYDQPDVAWDPEDPIFATSPLPPLHPASPIPSRTRPTPQRSHSSQATPPLPPSLPPLSPSMRSRGLSPGRPTRLSRVQSGLDIIKYRQQKKDESLSNSRASSPSSRQSSKQSISAERALGGSNSASSKKRGKSSLSYNSANRTTSYKCCPLASVISDCPDDESVFKRRYNGEAKPPSIPTRKLSLKRKLKVQKSHGLQVETSGLEYAPSFDQQQEGRGKVDKTSEPPELIPAPTEAQVAASVRIQTVWRIYFSQLAFASLVARKSTVVCECKNGKVSRDRRLGQKAQVTSVAKAIGQVGCFGANERLAYGEEEVVAEWENIIYVNFPFPGAGTVSTFTTIYVLSTVQRTARMDSMSRKKVFMLVIKSALMQHLSEQSQKVSRMSMLERSLTRRRAPVHREAAIQMQKLVRRKIQLKEYKLTKASALVVQSTVRTWLSKVALLRLKQAATRIQAFFRGELVRGIVFQYWAAAIALRGFWNDYRQEQMAAADLIASKIQAGFRGNMSRQQLLERHFCTAIIQTKFRSFLAQKRFVQLRRSCSKLQSITRQRTTLRMKHEKEAASFIQQWWRFGQCNRMLRGLCATIVQTSYRRHQVCNGFQACRSAAVVLQKSTRRQSVRMEMLRCRKASMTIQRIVRRVILRNCLNSCATKIQTQYRQFSARIKYQQTLWAINILQFQTRKMIGLRQDRETKAAIELQAFWRGHCNKLDFCYKKDCIISIQSAYRGYREAKVYDETLSAACLLQTRWRGSSQRFDFHIHRGATIFLQRTWRRHFILQQNRRAATRVQACWRRAGAVCCFRIQVVMVVRIQTACRRWLQTNKFAMIKNGTLAAQKIVRGFCQRRKFLQARQSVVRIQRFGKVLLQRKDGMASIVQAEVRRTQKHKYFQRARAAAVLMQCQWRRKASRDAYLLLRQNTKFLQSALREYVNRRHDSKMRASMKIQSWYRCRHELKMQAAVKIQSWYRCNIQVCKFVINHFSIVLAQSSWRSHQQRRAYLQVRKAAMLLQFCYRKRRAFKERLRAIIRIQCFARQLAGRRILMASLAQKKRADKVMYARARRKEIIRASLEKQSAAIFLQRVHRKYQFRAKTEAASVIQHFLRQQREARKQREERDRAAVLIERNWRAFSCKKNLRTIREACFTLVSHIRSIHDGKADRARYLGIRKGVVAFQSLFRGSICRSSFKKLRHRLVFLRDRAAYWRSVKTKSAVLVQSLWRTHQARFKLVIKLICITILQSVYRGYRQRLIYTKTRRTTTSIQHAWRRKSKQTILLKNTSAAQIQLAWRTKGALKMHFAAVCLQSMWRRYSVQIVLQRRTRHLFSAKVDAAVALQHFCRGARLRSGFLRMRLGFVGLQCLWRGEYSSRVHVQHQLKAVFGRKLRSARLVQARQQGCTTLTNHRRLQSRSRSFRGAVMSWPVQPDHISYQTSTSTLMPAVEFPHTELEHQVQLAGCHPGLQCLWRGLYSSRVRVQHQLKAVFGRKLRSAHLVQARQQGCTTLTNHRRLQSRSRAFRGAVMSWHVQPDHRSYQTSTSTQMPAVENPHTELLHQVQLAGFRPVTATILSHLWVSAKDCVHLFEWMLSKLHMDHDLARRVYRILYELLVPVYAGKGNQLRLFIHSTAIVLPCDHDWFWGAMGKLLEFIKQSLPEIESGKAVVAVSLACLASVAALVNSPALAVSFLGLSMSIFTQGQQTLHCQVEYAATVIQAHWRRYCIKNLYLQKRKLCILLQRAIIHYHFQRRHLASSIIQRCFRGSSLVLVYSRTDPNTLSLVLRGQFMLGSRIFFVSWVITLLAINSDVHTIYVIVRCVFVASLLAEVWLVISQISRGTDALLQRQRSAWTIQCAFRNRGALKKWKANLGVHESLVKILNGEDQKTREVQDKTLEAVEFLCISEEKAAYQIQTWWKYWLLERNGAALFLQFWFRGLHQRHIFLKSRAAAIFIQRFTWGNLFAERREQIINDTLKELLVRRLQIVSAVVLQRWYRMMAAKSTHRLLQERQADQEACAARWLRNYLGTRVILQAQRHAAQESDATTCIARWWRHCHETRVTAQESQVEQESDAATCIAQWWRHYRDTRDYEDAIVALAIREYCEDRHPASQALAAEDRLLCVLASSDGSSFEVMDVVKFHISEADNDDYEDDLPLQMFCVRETESGMELVVESTNAIVQDTPHCCGFEVFLP